MPIIWGNAWRFISEDIIPAPLRNSEAGGQWESLSELSQWTSDIMFNQALPGIWNTLVLSQIPMFERLQNPIRVVLKG